jgi:hypothetical protein
MSAGCPGVWRLPSPPRSAPGRVEIGRTVGSVDNVWHRRQQLLLVLLNEIKLLLQNGLPQTDETLSQSSRHLSCLNSSTILYMIELNVFFCFGLQS